MDTDDVELLEDDDELCVGLSLACGFPFAFGFPLAFGFPCAFPFFIALFGVAFA
jgi:hypothetical protein